MMNDRGRLQSTMASLQCQTSSDFEWVVVDGGSSDGSRELVTNAVTAFDSQGVSVNNIFESDDGLYDAMNKGVRAAKGGYVMLLNAGDTLSNPCVLAHAIEEVIAGGTPEMAFFGATAHYPGELKVCLPAKECWPAVRHSLPASHQATWFKRLTHLKVSYDPRYKVSADYYVVATIATSGSSTGSYNLNLVDLDKSEVSVSYRNPLTHLRDCARIQRSVLRLNIGYVVVSLLNRAAKKAFWIFAARSSLRWIPRKLLIMRDVWITRDR